MTVYYAKPGSRYSDEEAKVIGPALARLGKKGPVDPKAVVERAKRADSPLHPFFEWNDSEAARRYREQQAAHMLRSIVIEMPGVEDRVRAFIHVRQAEEDGEDGFVSTAEASAAIVAQQIAKLRAEAKRLLREYRAWRTIAGMEAAEPLLQALEQFAEAA